MIDLVNGGDEWRRNGATLSDKSARKEFGLTQEEILDAIDAGKLSYRISAIHGNPWFRLLRREVEELMNSTYDDQQHREKATDRELKRLRGQAAMLEEQRAKLVAELPG